MRKPSYINKLTSRKIIALDLRSSSQTIKCNTYYRVFLGLTFYSIFQQIALRKKYYIGEFSICFLLKFKLEDIKSGDETVRPTGSDLRYMITSIKHVMPIHNVYKSHFSGHTTIVDTSKHKTYGMTAFNAVIPGT